MAHPILSQKPSSRRFTGAFLPGGELAGAGPPALPASPARPRPGSPTPEGGQSTRWPATRASNCRLDDAPKKRRRPATVDRPSTAKPVGSVFMVCPAARAGGAIRSPPSTGRWPFAVAAIQLAGYHGATNRRVLPSVDPASASCPAGVLQPPSGALRRFVHDILTNLPRCARRAARTWAAQQASRTDPVAIDGKYERCRPAQSGRQAPARRRCGAPLWNRPRTRGGTGQEQRDPAYGHRARPHRPRRDPRRCTPTTTPPGAWSSSAARTT